MTLLSFDSKIPLTPLLSQTKQKKDKTRVHVGLDLLNPSTPPLSLHHFLHHATQSIILIPDNLFKEDRIIIIINLRDQRLEA